MKALFLTAIGQTAIREIEKPHLGPNDVLIKIGMVGFCGGDLNGFKGLFELQEYPNILGHEVGGTIEERGDMVPDSFKIGNKVTVYPYLNCGKCISCRKGHRNACQDNKTMGVRRPGAMTRYVAIPWQDLFASEKLSLKELALVEPLTVGFHAAARGRVSNQDRVAVIGCGIVGMGAIASAVNRGAEVIAIDIDDSKMAIAKKIGVAHTINTSQEDLHEALMRITDGDGPDVIIEAVGNALTYRAAVDEVAYTGRVVCIGYAKSAVEFNTGLFVRKEIEILGSRNCTTEFPEVIAYLEAGKFPVDDVISKIVSLSDAGAALADWAANPKGITKIMVDFDQA
ncbi:zinc-binding alcohol dehydrogenase family protein [Aquirufa sp.]|jgi:threonine dehydrogenase-like Zn-dependent dehydrogenase|uniref:zinc-binding alcohol dehydrogenase family protein n=1 Tax=Aquirufa sp. TaxID=2676249 RepID=UPI0037C0E493